MINRIQEFLSQGGRKIDIYDVEDEEADIIKYKALDSICMKYKLEEE
jgi:predicted HTH domain antitoxin